MRTLGFRTHILLAIAGAAGLVFTLGRPWYAPAPTPGAGEAGGIGDLNGPLRSLFAGAQRWVTDPAGSTGWDSLDHWAVALAAMAGIAGLGAVASLASPLQTLGRDMLRYGALAAFGIAVWRLVDSPGPNAALELRNGALAATVCALVLVTCAMGVANAPLRRRAVTPKYQAPPPPAYGSSVPPA